jgi:tetratricopeptide (TPR) repeat protein
MMHRVLACLMVPVLLASAAWASDAPPPAAPASSDKSSAAPKPAERQSLVVWRMDLDAAIKEAGSTNRLIMIYFTAGWCKPCELMDKGPFAMPVFARFVMQNFVPVKADDTAAPSAISQKFNMRIYPAVMFLSSAGEPYHVIIGPQTPADLYRIMKQVLALPGLIKAQKKAPDDVEANVALASAWVDLDQVKRAGPFLKRIVELDPKNEKGHLDRSQLLLAVVPAEDGKVDEALANLDAFIKSHENSPELPEAMLMKGRIFVDENRLEEARKALDDLTQRFPKSVKAYEADKLLDVIDARQKAEKAIEKDTQKPAEKTGEKPTGSDKAATPAETPKN